MPHVIPVAKVSVARLRVLLRDAGISPALMTDEDVVKVYIRRFGKTLTQYDWPYDW